MPSIQENLGNRFYAVLMFVIVSVVSGVLLAGLFVPGVAMFGATAKSAAEAMDSLPQELETPRQSEGSKILLADGTLLAVLYQQDRTYKPFDQIAQAMKDAQISIEDKRYYDHGALDFRGTMRALLKSGGSQGGSTITQQYVKQVQIDNALARSDTAGIQKAQERTISRKIQELRYAIAIEKKFSKEQILERYLNIAYYGNQYGVESAARHYFNSNAANLTIAQAAMLAGLVQNPVALDPEYHPETALQRRRVVLKAMLEDKKINQQQYDEADKTPFDKNLIQPNRNGCVGSAYPHVCDYAQRQLYKNPNLGKDAKQARSSLERSGFTVKLTIDPELQEAAAKRLERQVAPADPAIALWTAVQPGTGKIIAMAQNRNVRGNNEEAGETYWNYSAGIDYGGAEGYQAGSTFKALTIAAALEKGISPSRRYVSPNNTNTTGWRIDACSGTIVDPHPISYTNDAGESFGSVDMFTAAQKSINSYFLQLTRDVGHCNVAKMAEALGITRIANQQEDESARGAFDTKNFQAKSVVQNFALGPFEIAPVTMAAAYATFAARGKHCEPTIIDSITTADGKQVGTNQPECKQVIRSEVADGVNAILKTVADKGSGFSSKVSGNYDQAGKTGTSNAAQTVWYDGYTPDLAAVGMVTLDKKRIQDFWRKNVNKDGDPTLWRAKMSTGVVFGGSGYDDVGPFYKDIMAVALAKTPGNKFNPPGNEVLTGKMVAVPKLTNRDPDRDRNLLKEAGFSYQEEMVESPHPYGTYLGASQQGMVSMGSTIMLRFSKGNKKSDPSASPSPDR